MEIVSTPQVIDLERLLAPVSEENPAGENLKYSGIYDEIREARRADLNLAQGDWTSALKVADWHKVIETSVSALESQTKDLQIAVWLAEALVEQHGFAGLRDGLRLLFGFHENFWETMFPENDEGDLEARANALEFVDKQAELAVKRIALTSSGLSYNAWEESRSYDIPENLDALDSSEQEKFQTLLQQATAENRTTGDMWRKAKNAAKREYYEQMWFTVEECWSDFDTLDRKMDDCFGNQTPGLSKLKKSLDNVRDLVKKLVEEKRQSEPTAEETAVSEGAEFVGEDGEPIGENGVGGYFVAGVAATGGAIRSRQDALKRLSEVAEFFRQTEPHSPVSHLVQRAVKWGNMELESWLQDVIKDENVLGQIRETLGLINNSSESYSETE